MSTTEVVLAFAVLVVLVAVLIPSMQAARRRAWSDGSRDHLRRLHTTFAAWLDEHDGTFPYVAAQPGWRWGGVKHPTVRRAPFLDSDRPLSRHFEASTAAPAWFSCPADQGITGETPGVGTGRRTCFEAFGTSFRANANLLDAGLARRPRAASLSAGAGDPGGATRAGAIDAPPVERGLRLTEILTSPDRLVVLGEPLWAEVIDQTGRDADWYDTPDHANLLFLDGHVAWTRITADAAGDGGGPVFDPALGPPTDPPAAMGTGASDVVVERSGAGAIEGSDPPVRGAGGLRRTGLPGGG